MDVRRWCQQCRRSTPRAEPNAPCDHAEPAPAEIPSPEPDVMNCPRCGPVEPAVGDHTYANGDRHRRADCPKCRGIIRYLPRGDGGR